MQTVVRILTRIQYGIPFGTHFSRGDGSIHVEYVRSVRRRRAGQDDDDDGNNDDNGNSCISVIDIITTNDIRTQIAGPRKDDTRCSPPLSSGVSRELHGPCILPRGGRPDAQGEYSSQGDCMLRVHAHTANSHMHRFLPPRNTASEKRPGRMPEGGTGRLLATGTPAIWTLQMTVMSTPHRPVCPGVTACQSCLHRPASITAGIQGRTRKTPPVRTRRRIECCLLRPPTTARATADAAV